MKNRYKSCFGKWKFGEIKKHTYNTEMFCSKCDEKIDGYYRSMANRKRYHLPCVAFIASRYENVDTSNFTEGEILLKRRFDLEIAIKLYS